MANSKQYMVKAGFGSIHRIEDGQVKLYGPGDQVELTKDELAEVGHMVLEYMEPKPEPKKAAEAKQEPGSGDEIGKAGDGATEPKKAAEKGKK